MPRPTTKEELVYASTEQFAKLWTLIDTMSEEEQNATFLFEDRDRNVRDVLVHLYEWHQMMLKWHREGTLEGGKPIVPREGYTWFTISDMNKEIQKKYQDVPLEKAKEMLRESHAQVMAEIEAHTGDELFARGVYAWTKTTTLGAYFVGSTSSHYDWAMKKIRKHVRAYRMKAGIGK